ncbi:alpha/beta hydrolase [Aureimonas fodinaquatilis]|uniref:Alpha/beta hydrolase n=1 Tax=Aureimonas fodinaquatilis TaxID=2565783 RepID=A0A5B0DWD4_9HYPH|nr:alpha/beta hydrolase [Aureimonas fodinaquatilis]KAA0970121.1 alpha/beta hydrolase [Aureimonas fodinaquatilis]
MAFFQHEGLELHYIDEGPRDGFPVMLVHGFASSILVNWQEPGWVDTLTKAGLRVIAFDHRGHGKSAKPHDASFYTPRAMASDADALLEHLNLERAVFFGYSMGARVSAYAALHYQSRVAALVLGGLGYGLIDGVGDWDPIAEALLAPSLADVTDERGRMFRSFADRTRSDRLALAACISTSREEPSADEVATITVPVLIGVGTRDDIAGSAQKLANLMPNAHAFDIAGRDHMLAVGDRTFKAEVLRFLNENGFTLAD